MCVCVRERGGKENRRKMKYICEREMEGGREGGESKENWTHGD